MTKATTNVARVAAAVAGLGLVAMSLAPMAGAQTTTTTTTTTASASVTFTRDLHTGSTGADVSALQTWLIAKGFSIPAGATGYFGSQTKAAVAAFQAANAITPAAGYFGPISRAKVAAMGGASTGSTSSVAGCMPGAAYSSTTGQPCTTSTGSTSGSTTGLSGGEASLSGYSLLPGNTVSAGQTNDEIAIAQFNVRGGDVNVQRVTVEMTGSSTSVSLLPWKYFSTLYVYSNNTKIGSVDVSSKTDWSQSGNTYSVDIPTNGIVRQGDNQQLSIRADAQDTIDSANLVQTFGLDIPTNGIRAVDSQGLQNYVGNGNQVSVTFVAAQNGKLSLTTDANNPPASVIAVDPTNVTTNQNLLAFDLQNTQNVNSTLNSMTFNVTSASTSMPNIVRRATLTIGGTTYTGTINSNTIVFSNMNTNVSGNSSITGTLAVDLNGQSGHYAATGESLIASLSASNVSAVNADTGDASSITGSATGKTQTLGVGVGVSVKAASGSTATEAYNSQTPANSTGSFALNFQVSASGQNIYIPKTIVAEASTSIDYSHGVAVADDLAASTTGTVSASVSSSAQTDPDNAGYYVVHAGATETFTANVTMTPSVAGYYQIGLNELNFSANSNGASLQNLNLNPNDISSQQLFIH